MFLRRTTTDMLQDAQCERRASEYAGPPHVDEDAVLLFSQVPQEPRTDDMDSKYERCVCWLLLFVCRTVLNFTFYA